VKITGADLDAILTAIGRSSAPKANPALAASAGDRPMRTAKTLGAAGALIAAALIGGTLISTAFASAEGDAVDAAGLAIDAEAAEAYCDTFMDTLATELGVSRDALLPAAQAAANAVVDAALANGDIDEEQAEQARERIAEADGEGCGLIGGRGLFFAGHARGFAHGFVGADALDAAATALGLESSDLIERFGDGTSLEELATEQGVSYDEVKAAVLAEVQADLDAAVAEGMSQERADRVIERLTEWLDEGGQPGPRWGRRPGPGFGG
jgi:hypothetical protein